MPSFKYKVRDAAGKTKTGTAEGSSAVAVRNLLVAQHLDVIKVSERKSILQFEITREKLKPAEVMNFSRQLGAFLRAGIPVLDALEALGEDASNAVLQRTIADIADRLRGGSSFADAVGAHRQIFPAYYVGILRSAELTGNLDVVLDQLAAYIERDLDTRRSVTSALTYPAVILAMAVVTVVVLAAYVLPKFEGFFADFNADLPFATRLLLNISDFFQTFWPVLLVGGIVIVGGSWLYFRTDRGRVSRDRLLLRLPVVGDVVRMSVIERFCRILATMLRAGVPITDSMIAASEATNNRVYQAALGEARDEMIKGEGIARPIEETGLFPGAASQMIKVGEQSGTLDQQLEIAADFYEVELKHKLARLTSLFEPAVIVVMGLIVGFVAIALVSAMYGLLDKVTVK